MVEDPSFNANVSNKQLFAEQAATLEGAHNQGRKAFRAATRSALDFVLDYPGQVFAEGQGHSDDQLAVAYQAAFTGLRRAIPKERLRRDFAHVINKRLGKAASSEPKADARLKHDTLALMLEALRDSFPDEVGIDEISIIDETRPRFESADPDQFRSIASDLITQAKAGEMPQIIESTNTSDSQIKIIVDKGQTRLKHTQGGRTITVGRNGERHFVEKRTKTGKGKQKVVRKLRVQQAAIGEPGHRRYQGLEGRLEVTKPKPKVEALKKSQIVKVADTVLGQMWQELTRRGYLHGSETAEDQAVDDTLKE